MKKILGIFPVLVLIASLGIQSQATAQELAPKDRNRVPALLLTDPGTNKTDRWESDGSGAAKVSIVSGGGGGTVTQGPSSTGDPWEVEGGGGAALATETTLAAMSAKLPATLTGSGNLKISLEEATITLPISAVSLPLPTGASSSANQTTGNASLASIDGDTTDIELNTDTAQTAGEPTVVSVGTTATLIFAASTTTRSVTIQNAGTDIVFLGKAAVTTSTGIGIRGGVVNDDMKGQTAVANNGDAIFGIVSSGTINVRVQPVSD